jgi:stearoyl-CoA desaturase (delta-9 desaturase)
MNSQLKYQLFLFYPIHLGSIIGLFLVDYSITYFLLFLIGWVLIHGYGAELGLHRYVAHRSFHPKNIFLPPLLFLSTLAIQGSPLGWATIHRKHHAHADLDKDPHSPKKGNWYAWHMWITKWGENTTKNSLRKSKDLLKDRKIMFFTKYTIPIILITYAFVGIIDINSIFWLLMLPATTSLIQSYNVNLFCHLKKFGYRNFEIRDDSTNITLLGITSWGLGLHNNHHKRPSASSFEFKDSEFDPAARLLLPFIVKT